MLDEETFYTIPEAAAKLRVTRDAIYKWMKDGRITYVVVGSQRRITGSALTTFILDETDRRRRPRAPEDTRTPELLTA